MGILKKDMMKIEFTFEHFFIDKFEKGNTTYEKNYYCKIIHTATIKHFGF